MKWVLLVILVAAGVVAFVRAEQPEQWNLAVVVFKLPGLAVTPAENGVGVQKTLADLWAKATALTSTPLPPLITDPAKLTPDPLEVNSAWEASFLQQLNEDANVISATAQPMHVREHVSDQSEWDALDAKIDAYEDKVLSNALTINAATTRRNIIQQHKSELTMANEWPCDFGRHREIVKRLLANRLPEVVALGKEASEPLDLAFIATDGSTVDLAKMRGKVVLVEYWSSWCHFCVDEVPATVAAYNKYHQAGFEVVGISWDNFHWMMDPFVQKHGMTWPQYFGGDATGNAITRKYGVETLPTLWLVDKRGCLVNSTRGAELDEQVARLLAEK